MARRSFAGGLRGRDMPAHQAPLESSPIRVPSGLNTITPPVPSAPHRCGPTVTIGPADEPRNSGGRGQNSQSFVCCSAQWESAAGQIRPSCAVPADGSLSPDSCRARRMLLTAESGHKRASALSGNGTSQTCAESTKPSHGRPQARVHRRVGHAELGRHGDLARQLAEQLGFHLILPPLAVHDVLELGMSGHGVHSCKTRPAARARRERRTGRNTVMARPYRRLAPGNKESAPARSRAWRRPAACCATGPSASARVRSGTRRPAWRNDRDRARADGRRAWPCAATPTCPWP
jgi:hypothetical protein